MHKMSLKPLAKLKIILYVLREISWVKTLSHKDWVAASFLKIW